MPSLNPLLCKQTEMVFCATISAILPFVGRNGTFFLYVSCVCSFMMSVPQRGGNRAEITSAGWMGVKRAGERGFFPLMCASLDGDEAYIFRAAVVRAERHSSCSCPQHATQHPNARGETRDACLSGTVPHLTFQLCSHFSFFFTFRPQHKSSWNPPSAPSSPSSRTMLGRTDPPAPWAKRSSITWCPLSCPTMSR